MPQLRQHLHQRIPELIHYVWIDDKNGWARHSQKLSIVLLSHRLTVERRDKETVRDSILC